MKNFMLISLIFYLFVSCHFSYDKRTLEYVSREIDTKEIEIKNILQSLDINDAEIFCNAHLRYGQNILSKTIQSESFSGSNFSPEGPTGQEESLALYVHINDNYSQYKRTDINIEFTDEQDKAVNLDYISFLILIDSQYEEIIPILEEAISGSILNQQRKDLLTILAH